MDRSFLGAALGLGALLVAHASGSTLVAQAITPAKTLPQSTPWDLGRLGVAPAMEWIDSKSPVRSLTYEGPSYRGKPTRVFAYYACANTIAGDGPADAERPADTAALPAVVLVHGGGGTAFPEWVKLWAGRGYAAIAMDLAGCGAGRRRLEDGGPGQRDDTKFGSIDSDPRDQWTYHAVANVIRAHSLIRGFPEVDAERTAITGISWGGYLTCIVAGLDHRFAAAVPVYGCGFLHEGSVWDGRFAKMTDAQRARWVRLWDPSRYVGSATMPMLFVNGTNDFAYWLESYAKTYSLVHSPRDFRITVNMPHGHRQGWEPTEIGRFVDSKLLGKAPLDRISRPWIAAGKVLARIRANSEGRGASLHHTTSSLDTTPHRQRRWTTTEATRQGDLLVAEAPPGAKIWFFTSRDAVGSTTSSELVFASRVPTEPIKLLPATDLSSFYTFLVGSGKDSDPGGVFRLRDDGSLHVTGEHVGYLATRDAFADYHLVAHFRWGEKTWDGKNRGRDSGVFFHFAGEDRIFPRSLECQLLEGATGDLCLIGGAAFTRGKESKRGGTFERPGKRPWKNELGFRGADEVERPHGEWNKLEIICRGDEVTLRVNGRELHHGSGARPASGRIYLQSYSAELFFRDLTLLPLELPGQRKAQ